MSDKRPFHKSLGHAFVGIKEVLGSERNFQIHISIAILVILLALLLNITRNDFLWILIAIAMVLITEIVNTGFEEMFDVMHPREDRKVEQDVAVRIIKDMLAGAVLIAAITAIVIGILIFLPYVVNLKLGI